MFYELSLTPRTPLHRMAQMPGEPLVGDHTEFFQRTDDVTPTTVFISQEAIVRSGWRDEAMEP